MRQAKMVVLFIFVTLQLIAFPSLSYATNGMRLIGIGAVQRSMGGANVGLPLDTASTITNPAGILKLNKSMDFGVSFFAPTVEHTATGASHTHSGVKQESDAKGYIIPAFGLVVPVNEKLAFGMGAFGISGEGVDYPTNIYGNVAFVDYAFMKFSPAIAYKVLDNLTIGFAPNLDFAKMEYQAGSSSDPAHNGATAFGVGFTVGLLYDINEEFSLGYAFESRQWFEDFDFNTSSGTDSLDFDQPSTMTLGLGYKPYETLRLAFDIQWIDWSSIIGSNQPAYTENSSGSGAFDMAWQDQIVYKLGMEYDVTPKFTVRSGYNYGKNPLNSKRAFESLAFPAITEHHFTGGIGYHLNDDLEINLGFMYAPEVSFNVSNAAQDISSGNTKMHQFSADFGLSYSFD